MNYNKLILFAIGLSFYGGTGVNAEIKYSETDFDIYLKTKQCVSCDLSEAELGDHHNSDMKYSLLDNAILARAQFKGEFSHSSFVGAILTGAKRHWHERPSFRNSNFTSANLMMVDFYGVDLSSSDFTNANFYKADLNGSNLSRSNLIGADFSDAILKNANFAGSNITNDQLARAKTICGAILPNGNVAQCN